MSIKYFANRVKETTSTTGNGSMILNGAVSTYDKVIDYIGTNNSFTYELLNSGNPFEWENGVGHITYSSGITTFVRDRVIRSSNGDSLVNFSAGTKTLTTAITQDIINNGFLNVEQASGTFSPPYMPATYILDATGGSITVSLPTVDGQIDPIIMGFLLNDTTNNDQNQTDAVILTPDSPETISGGSDVRLSIRNDYIQIVSVPSATGWLVLDSIQDSMNAYGNDGLIQFSQNSAFSGVNGLKWDLSSSSLLVGGTGTLASADIILPTGTQTVIFNEQSKDKDFRIEGSGISHLFFVDAELGNIGINTANPLDLLHIVHTGTVGNTGLTIHSSGLGPTVVLSNTALSGSLTNNRLGSVFFNASGLSYAKLYASADSMVSGLEQSSAYIEIINNGSMVPALSLRPTSTTIGTNNTNTSGVIVGKDCANSGNNIVLGNTNTSNGVTNSTMIGNNHTIHSGSLSCGVVGQGHTVGGTGIFIIGGTGIALSGAIYKDNTYLVADADHYISISTTGVVSLSSKLNANTKLSILNKTPTPSSGIVQSVSLEFLNSNTAIKTGLALSSTIHKATAGDEYSKFSASIMVGGVVKPVIQIQDNQVLIGDAGLSGINIGYGLNNSSAGGTGTIIYGQNIVSSGNTNVLIGRDIICSGTNSTIFGRANECLPSGDLSVVILGNSNSASEAFGVAIGNNNHTSGLHAIACGYNNGAYNDYSVAVGWGNTVQGTVAGGSVAVGQSNAVTTSGVNAIGFAVGLGNNISVSGTGLTIGYQNRVLGKGGVVIGRSCAATGIDNFIVGFNCSTTTGNNNFLMGKNLNWEGSDTYLTSHTNIQFLATADIFASGANIDLHKNSTDMISILTTGINILHTGLMSISGVLGTNISSTGVIAMSGDTISLSGGSLVSLSTDNLHKISVSPTSINILSSGLGHPISVSGNLLSINCQSGIQYLNRPIGMGSALVVDTSNILRETSSSRRFKDRITDYDKGLSDLVQLKPVYYNFLNQDKQLAGFIAEDIADQGLEEFVIRDENNMVKDINYTGMISLLVNSIKELHKEILLLKNRT